MATPAHLPRSRTFRFALRSSAPLLVLAGLVMVAALVRMIDIVDNPPGFFTDEASFGLNADLILHTGRDEHGDFLPLLFRSFGEYKLPAFIYAEVPFMAIFGRTEEAVRLTSAAAGSLTVITTYLLARELFRRELPALASAATLAILPWHVHYSRTGLGDIVMLPLFFTAGFYLFFRATRDARYLIPAAVVLAATFYTYRGGWVALPPLLLVMTAAYREELLAHPRIVLLSIGIAILMLTPLAHHLLFGPSDRTTQSWIFNLDGDRSTFELFSDFYQSYFTDRFLFSNGDSGPVLRHYLPGHGQLYYLQLPLVLIGAVSLAGRLNRRYLFVLALLVCYPLSASVSDTSPISSRAILGSVAFALLTGAGLWALVGTLAAWSPHRARVVAVLTVAVFALGGAYSFARYASMYHNGYPSLSAGYWGWQDGPRDIIAYFQQAESRYDEMYMDGQFNSPDVFFRFYGEGECSKCLVGGDDRYRPGRKQLFALRPENLHPGQYAYRIVDRLYYPDGSVSFVFAEITGTLEGAAR